MTNQTKTNIPNRTIIISSLAIILIILTGIGIYAFQNINKATSSATDNQSQTVVIDNNKKTEFDESMVKKETSLSNSSSMSNMSNSSLMQNKDKIIANNAIISKPGEYIPYNSNLVASKASTGDVVLFFNANWCSKCQSTVKDINSKSDKIPSNLTILSADYDKEIALRQKYGVTIQHTFVKVDKDGNLIKKMSGLSTLENIVAFVK